MVVPVVLLVAIIMLIFVNAYFKKKYFKVKPEVHNNVYDPTTPGGG